MLGIDASARDAACRGWRPPANDLKVQDATDAKWVRRRKAIAGLLHGCPQLSEMSQPSMPVSSAAVRPA